MSVNGFEPPDRSAWRGARVLVLSPTPTHPQDYGNRKRLFRICSALKERGAKITLLHYPAEAEWRERIPEHAAREMANAWQGYYQLPVTRPLHAVPAGSHHTIDEWWDDSIGNFLSWLFAVDTFDAFIVNYTWLSKAFEFAPSSTVKILDTNDLFSSRKEMLLQHGIAPEFFYTTREEEATGLERADIIWAIKEQERVELMGLTKKPVLTLLHLDEVRDIPPPAPDVDGYLRVGIIGAENNVNRANIGAFLDAALPIFDRYFAPIQIVLGGTICRLFRDYDRRFVKRLGEIDDVAKFYASVDVAAVPMSFSTGLKIKAGEAISLNFPVVSLAHAFEGYPSRHPFHSLSNFSEMAEKLVDISFDRSLLPRLRAASSKTCEAVRESITETLAATGALVRSLRKAVLYCINMESLSPNSPSLFAAESAVGYLRMLSNVVVAIVGGPPEKCPRRLPDFLSRCHVFAAAESYSDNASLAFLASRGIDVEPFEDRITSGAADIIIADATAAWMHAIDFSDTSMLLRGEMLALHDPARALYDCAWTWGKFRRLVLVGNAPSRDLSAIGAELGAEVVTAPCLWRSTSVRDLLGAERPRAPARVALLGARQMIGGDQIAQLLRDLEAEPILVDLAPVAKEAGIESRTSWEFAELLFDRREPLPQFAVDLSFGAPGLQYVRELLQRARVPVVTADARRDAIGLAGSPGSGRASTIFALFQEISEHLLSPQAHGQQRLQDLKEELESDAGWAWLWQYVTKTRTGQDEEFI